MKSSEEYIEEIEENVDKLIEDLRDSVNWQDIPEEERHKYHSDYEEEEEK